MKSLFCNDQLIQPSSIQLDSVCVCVILIVIIIYCCFCKYEELNYLLSKYAVESYMDDQLSRTIGGTSLQLDTSEKTGGVESLYNGILVSMRESSDPSKLVLDMILNHVDPLCQKGDNAVIIADYQIDLLEQLMRTSPKIETCVKKEALKLARDLKANMKENTENSLAVLGWFYAAFVNLWIARLF
jgi:hypothetical protein